MTLTRGLTGVRLVTALVVITAIVVQYDHGSDLPGHRASNFFSFFTVLSNIFGAGLLLFLGVAGIRGTRRPSWIDHARGAAVVYLVVTFIVVDLLLSDLAEELQLTLPWVDFVLHDAMPVVILLDWLLDPPTKRIGLAAAASWLIFPLLYLAYSLIRGPIVDWYPYPFLDPREDGYGVVAITSAFVCLGFVLVVVCTWLSGNALRNRRIATKPA